jgi:hypothetical protein
LGYTLGERSKHHERSFILGSNEIFYTLPIPMSRPLVYTPLNLMSALWRRRTRAPVGVGPRGVARARVVCPPPGENRASLFGAEERDFCSEI